MKVNYSKTMRFPSAVSIPLRIAVDSGLPRRIVIDKPEKELPIALVEWLRNDARYSHWIDAAVEVVKAEPQGKADEHIYDFTALAGIGKTTQRKLENAGICTADQMIAAGARAVSSATGSSQSKAQHWINQLEEQAG